MEEFERKRRREREKHERQQMHSADHEVSLFPAPRRVTHPNDGEDDIAAKLGDFLKAKEFFNSYTVGISSGHRQPAIQQQQQQSHQSSPSSLSASSVAANVVGTQRQQQPPSFVVPSTTTTTLQQHHFTNLQQHNPFTSSSSSRSSATYLKGAENNNNNNKVPYNGRGMAPPKLPAAHQLATMASATMQPPPTNIIPNGRQTSVIPLGPPPSTVAPQLQNGRISQSQQKLLSAGNDENIHEILNTVQKNYAPPAALTLIAATPQVPINYDTNAKQKKHKYAFDTIASPLHTSESFSAIGRIDEPLPPLVTPIRPLASPPAVLAPVLALAPTPPQAIEATNNLQSKDSISKPVPDVGEHISPALEKQSSTLDDDLELSDSDDEQKKPE